MRVPTFAALFFFGHDDCDHDLLAPLFGSVDDSVEGWVITCARMKRASMLAAGTIVLAVSIACGGDSPVSSASPSSTSTSPSSNSSNAQPGSLLTIVSSPGDPIGQGVTYRYTTQTGGFVATQLCSENHVIIRYFDTGSTNLWTLNFRAQTGAHLAPGTYEGARDWPFVSASLPGLTVSGNGLSCDGVAGRFVITEASYGPMNTVNRFHATFQYQCGRPGLSGEVDVVSPPLYDLLWFCS